MLLFNYSDPAYKGADSRVLLRKVNDLLKAEGYLVGNVDVTIMAQAPKMLPHIPLMIERIASDLEIEPSHVSVKATTTEKLGFTGRGEGIAAMASALIYRP